MGVDPARLEQIRIVYRSPRCVVIDKPAGVLSVPGRAEENRHSAVSWLTSRVPEARGPLVVHRLDMDTSGLLILALDPGAQQDLSEQFRRRSVHKEYVAMVWGTVRHEQGQVSLPMRPDIARRPYQIIDPVHGQPSVTTYRVLAYTPEGTRLHLEPRTGRTHQLRVHCAAPPALGGLGCPILGDVLYAGAGAPFEAPEAPAPRLMLHARALEFNDPQTGRRVRVESAPPF